MAGRVALFRARDAATATAARLRRLGFSVVCAPVVDIVARPYATTKPRYDAVVATSANAFLVDAPVARTTPLCVVGSRTARVAEKRGWRLAALPAPNADRLIETLKRTIPPGADALYLAGRDRKGTLESSLGEIFTLEVVETYAAEAREAWRPAEVRALAGCAAALHYSHRSAALALRLAERAGLSAPFATMRHVCLSRDVAEPLKAFGAAKVLVADEPDEPALFAALRQAECVFPSDKPSRI
jgi:uroporphyrinogen-III synthase